MLGVAFILVIACIAVMWPRLRSTQFGLLDDGVTVKMAQYLTQDSLKAFDFMKASGRFLPAYWLTQTVVYQWAGISSLRWFYINVLYLVIDTLGIFLIVRCRGGTILQSMLAGLFFCFSSPIIETFYTLSKTEPIMVTYLIWGILFVLKIRSGKNIWIKRGLFLGSVVLFWSAFGTKEPSVVFFGIVLGWFILACLLKSSAIDLFDFAASKILFFSALISLVIYLLLRFYFVPVNPLAGSYSSNYSLTLEAINAQSLRWLGRFLRDFLYILPLLSVLLNQKVRGLVNKHLLLDGLVWMAGWIAVFLPWNVLESFHTLPFAVGAAIICGVCAGAAMEVFYKNGSLQDRIFLSLVFILTLFLGQFTVVNNITSARVQLFYDEVNNRMVKFLGKSDPGSTFYFNVPSTEYVVEVNLHLQMFKGRDDLTVDYFCYQRPQDTEPIHYYVITPEMVNAPLPSVRNSLDENGVYNWEKCFIASITPQSASPSYAGVQKLRWIDFGFNRLLEGVGLEDKLSFNVKGRSFLESKQMSYGWQVYEIYIDPVTIAYPGSYNGAGEWKLETPGGEKLISQFGTPGDIPLTGDVNGDGRTEIAIYQPETHQFLVDLNMDGNPDLDFELATMQDGDLPLIGDWDGDSVDTLGFYRPSDYSWHLRKENTSGDEVLSLAAPTASGIIPIAGDWDGDGYDTLGYYLPSTGDVYLMDSLDPRSSLDWAYRTEPDSKPVAADWYGFGRDTLAVVKNGEWSLRPNNVSCIFPNPIPAIQYGNPEDTPVGGLW